MPSVMRILKICIQAAHDAETRSDRLIVGLDRHRVITAGDLSLTLIFDSHSRGCDKRSHHTARTPTTHAQWAVSRPSPRVHSPPPSRRAAPLPSCRQSSRLSTTTRYGTKDAALCADLRRLAPNARREAGDAQLLTGAAKPPPHNPGARPLSHRLGAYSEVKPPIAIGRLGLKGGFPIHRRSAPLTRAAAGLAHTRSRGVILTPRVRVGDHKHALCGGDAPF